MAFLQPLSRHHIITVMKNILNKEQNNNNLQIHHFLCREKNKECLVRLE